VAASVWSRLPFIVQWGGAQDKYINSLRVFVL
jgi:hypothetical protein